MYVYLYISGCVHDLRQNYQLYSAACHFFKKHYLWKHGSWPKMLWPVKQSPRKALLRRSRWQEWGVGVWFLEPCKPFVYLSDLGAALLNRLEETHISGVAYGKSQEKTAMSPKSEDISKRPPSHPQIPNSPILLHFIVSWSERRNSKKKVRFFCS